MGLLIEKEDFQIIVISFFIILLGSLFSSNTTLNFPTGYAAYKAAGYTPGLANIHITFIAIAFVMAIVSTYLAIKAIKRFTEGHIRTYVKWTRLGEVALAIFLVAFFIVEIIAFYYEEYLSYIRYFDTISLVALIFSFVCFIKASYHLDKMSKVYGFASGARESVSAKVKSFFSKRQEPEEEESAFKKSERISNKKGKKGKSK